MGAGALPVSPLQWGDVSLVSRYLEPETVQRLNQLALSGRRVVEGLAAGMHRSPVKGASVEFQQHRAYVAGDEPRRLDWRVLARTDRTYVKQYNEETNLRAVLVLDCSGSMGYGGFRVRGSGFRKEVRETKFEYGAKLVASLAYLMLGQTESVGFARAGEAGRDAVDWVGPQAGTQQLARIIDALERSAARGGNDLRKVMFDVAGRLGRRSQVVIVSDFFAPVKEIREGLARLRHGKHETIALRVIDRDEVEFPFQNWTQFRGMEGERAKLCEPAVMRQVYRENFERHGRELEQSCRSLGVELHTLVTERAMVDSLIGVLKHREGKIRSTKHAPLDRTRTIRNNRSMGE
jgi:uncharacterized protein (DUF58 family)